MKLGLIIKLTSNGEQEIFAVNKEEKWARFATDSRSIIQNLNGFDGSGKSVIIVKILGPEYLIGVVKARPEGSGRPNDNTTAWIHVPAKMQISGEELCTVIKRIETQLSDPIRINQDNLKELFSTDYEEKEFKFTALEFIRNKPDGCIGWRKYGRGTDFELYELLGDAIAQTYYSKYKCICFIDKSSELSPSGGEPIKQKITLPKPIIAPTDDKGFKPYLNIGKGILFDKNIEIPDGYNKIRVIWRREGYSDIVKDLANLTIQENDRQLVLKRSWIKITNQRSEPLSNAEIFVNEKPFSADLMEIPETEVRRRNGVEICVNCDGYEQKTEIKQISNNIEINLADKQFEKEYTLLAKDGKDLKSDATIKVTINNFYTGMPLKGYREKDWENNKYIVYENNLSLKVKWFIYGFFVCVFALGLVALNNWKSPNYQKKENTNTNSADSTSNNENNTNKKLMIEEMCNYLASNKTWHKDSLAKYDLTKNLFDDMNSFNLENLINLESSKLKEVEQIQKLVDAAKQSKYAQIKPDIGKEDNNGKYTTDLGIDINNYISWITKKHQAVQKGKKTDAPSKKKGKTKSDSEKKEQSASDGKKKGNTRGSI